MSTGHPALNRGLLLVAGVGAIAAGGAAVLADLRPTWAEPVLGHWADFRSVDVPRFTSWQVSLPWGGSLPGATTVSAAALLVVIGLLVVFLVTARRSTTGTVLRSDTDQGRTTVNRQVAHDVLARPLAELPDVVAADVRAYPQRSGPSGLELTVLVRRGADLPLIVAAAEDSVGEWDLLSGSRSPVLIRLARRPIRRGRVASRVS